MLYTLKHIQLGSKIKMARQYKGTYRRNYDNDNPYMQDYDPVSNKKWYQDTKVIVIGGLLIIFLALLFTDNLPWQDNEGETPAINSTQINYEDLSHQEKLVAYILAQEKAGLNKEQIIERLKKPFYYLIQQFNIFFQNKSEEYQNNKLSKLY
jgi:hypothetical protein